MSDEIIDIQAEELSTHFSVIFSDPFDCINIFPEGGIATGAHIENDGRFSLIGAGQGRIIGQIEGLTPENAEELIISNVLGAAHLN